MQNIKLFSGLHMLMQKTYVYCKVKMTIVFYD